MDPVPASASRTLARRVIPPLLIAALAGTSGLFFVQDRGLRDERDQAQRDVAAAHKATGDAVEAERSKAVSVRRDLEEAKVQLLAAEERLRSAQSSGATDGEKFQRLVQERESARADLDAAKKKAAALADRLGEVESERDRIKKHAEELDELMKLLDKKKVNVRRLAGLEGPPREEVEVVSVDERRTPPMLVLRAETLDGLEEGDKLYVVRTADGKKREVGHALIDKVDKVRGYVGATVGKLAAGEKIAVGEKLTTYQP